MKRTLLAALAAALLGPSAALAQAAPLPAFDLERLTLDPSAVSSMVVGTGEVRPEGQARFSLAGHYENRPLVLLDDGSMRGWGVGAEGTRAADVVKQRVTGHFGASIQATTGLELNVRIPIVLWQEGTTGAVTPRLAADGLGGAAAGLRYQLARQGSESSLNAAFASEVILPRGSTQAVAGAEKWAFTPRLELGRNFGPFVVGGQLGALLRSGKTDFGNSGVLGSEVNLGAVVATTGAPLRGELSVRGGIGREVETTMEILAGARYTFCSNWEAFALGGPGFFEAPGTPRFRGVLGVAWVPAAPKAAAPAAAPAPVAVAKADPCAAGQAHTPEQCPALDDDKDGILNKDDACPTVAGIAEEKGCPAKDTDKDGILDHQDKCPTVPGLAELQGCPAVDTDGDGVPDHQDKCPTVAGVAAEAGCPPAKAKLNTATGKIDILEKVYFDTSKATIQDRSYPLLDEVAGVLKNHPELTRVVVEGHTDNTGAADFNTWLSGERAKAVKAYLVGKGIEAGRLDSKGFGPSKPVGDNKTKEGREQNRRVEFTIP